MTSDPAWIEELLKSNHAPSDEAAQEVRKLLVEPLTKLEGLDVEILDLKNLLSELENNRHETQKQISRYETILSPIRRIPADVLGEIFYHSLPAHRNSIMDPSDCPLLITRVCSTWRTTAMTIPRLWDRLYITFTDDDTVPDIETAAEMVRNGQDLDKEWLNARSKADKDCTTDLLCRRYEAVRQWFGRAGTRPLYVSMNFTDTEWYAVPYSERPPGIGMELLSYLASIAPRWKEFELKASREVYRVLEQLLPVSQMGALTSLRWGCQGQHSESEDATRPLKLLQTPNLRHLSMYGNSTTVWNIPNRSSTQWNNLTSISCFDSLSITKTASLLEHAPNLVHYTGTISENNMDMDDGTPTAYEGFISLPFLQRLSITEYINPRRLGNLYDRIDAPKLRFVKYHSGYRTDDFTMDSTVPMPIQALLHKSMELQKLSFETSDLTVWDLRTVLRSVPSVTDLILGEEEDPFNPRVISTSPDTEYNTSGVLYRELLWSFNDLVVDNSSEDLDDNSLLLPRLKSLVISSPSLRINDDTLFDLIKSRLTSSKTEALARVQGRFYKEKPERDLVNELTTYAELLGVKIDLDFVYASEQWSLFPLMAPSPNYGFSLTSGERTWPYVDAGEDF